SRDPIRSIPKGLHPPAQGFEARATRLNATPSVQHKSRISGPFRARHPGRDRVESVARGDEHGPAIRAPEAEVGRAFGRVDLSNQGSVRRKDVHAIAGTGPDTAVGVAAN